MTLPFPSLVSALAPVGANETPKYLSRVLHKSPTEFVDEAFEAVEETWGGSAFRGGFIFTKGTGAAATIRLCLLTDHLAHTFSRTHTQVLKRVKSNLPLKEWKSGTGALVAPKGGGAGPGILNLIMRRQLKGLDLGSFPSPDAVRIAELRDPAQAARVSRMMEPSSWRPFEKPFYEGLSTNGIYAIFAIDRTFSHFRVRVGQTYAEGLNNRLATHRRTVAELFPPGYHPAFFAAFSLERKLNATERMAYHFVPKRLRSNDARHPGPRICMFCAQGLR